MKYQKGLISFTSEHRLAGGETRIIRPKFVGYGLVLVVMTGLFLYSAITRQPLDMDIIRDRSPLFRVNTAGLIENVYTLKIMNKSQRQAVYQVGIDGLTGAIYQGLEQVTVPAGEIYSLPVTIAVDPTYLTTDNVTFEFMIADQAEPAINHRQESRFIFTR